MGKLSHREEGKSTGLDTGLAGPFASLDTGPAGPFAGLDTGPAGRLLSSWTSFVATFPRLH